MKKEFKVGDRVVFEIHWRGTTDCTSNAVKAFLDSEQEVRTVRGTVTAIKDGAAQVKWDGATKHSVTPVRSLRRLRPKKPTYWWLCKPVKSYARPTAFPDSMLGMPISDDHGNVIATVGKKDDAREWVRVREVRISGHDI